MLRTSGPTAKPEVQRAVDALLKEDSLFDRTENRSAHREHLVRAVDIIIRETGVAQTAFSRNISASGVGLITHDPIPDRTTAILEFANLDGSTTRILAESRWCKPYGSKWHLSGWQFINLQR